MTWIDITAPVVGGKITAAGFGLQVDTAVAQLQGAVDTFGDVTQLDVGGFKRWTTPGAEVPGHTLAGPASVTVGAGATTVVAAPGSGTRVVKSMLIHSPTATSTATIAIGSTVLAIVSFPNGGIAELDCAIPITSTDTGGVKVTMTGGTGQVTAGYGDRADLLVLRHGLVQGSTSGTLLAASGSAARYVTGLWVGNPSASVSATATVAIGGTNVINAYPLAGATAVLLDMVLPIPAATAVTWAGDGANPVTFMLVGH